MALNTSPSVQITEITPPAYIPTQTSEVAAFVGHFERGPIDYPIYITSVDQFKGLFGRGINEYANDWYQVYNYLQYSSGIYVVRSAGTQRGNANNGSDIYVNRYQDWETIKPTLSVTGIRFIAKTPGPWGNLLNIGVVTKQDYDNNVEVYNGQTAQQLWSFFEKDHLGVSIWRDGILTERFYKSYETVNEIDVESVYVYMKTESGLYDYVELYYLDDFLTNDSGVIDMGSILPDLNTNYESLGVITSYADTDIDLGTDLQTFDTYVQSTFSFYGSNIISFNNGYGALSSYTDFQNTYDLLDTSYYDIDIIIGNERVNELAVSLANSRKDCIAFLGIPTHLRTYLDLLMGTGNDDEVFYTAEGNILLLGDYTIPPNIDNFDFSIINNYISSIPESEYVHFTLDMKLQNDIYTNTKRLVNIAGDTAGLKAQASITSPWTASGGLEKGQIRNIIKNYINIQGTLSNTYYKKGMNLVQNNVLMSQRTYMSIPTSFARVNIRSLFNHLEKHAKYLMNKYIFDENTLRIRQAIAADLKRYLEDVHSSRGIYGANFLVYSNDQNQVVVEFQIKPNYVSEIIRLRITNTGKNQFTSIIA